MELLHQLRSPGTNILVNFIDSLPVSRWKCHIKSYNAFIIVDD